MKIFKQLTNWLFIFSLLLGIGWADVAGAVNKVRAFTAHIGGGVGALDKVATINMTEGDISIVVSSAIEYVYVWDDNGVDAEDAVNFTFIRPDDFVAAGSSGVWDLVSRAAVGYTGASGAMTGYPTGAEPADANITKDNEVETLTGNWVNIIWPWADNEVANLLTLDELNVTPRASAPTTPALGVEVWADAVTWNPAGSDVTIPYKTMIVGAGTDLIDDPLNGNFTGGGNDWADGAAGAAMGTYDETTDLSLIADGIGDYAVLAVAEAPMVDGQRYVLQFDVAAITDTWTITDFDGNFTIGTISANGASQRFLYQYNDATGGGLRFVSVTASSAMNLDNITLEDAVWKILMTEDAELKVDTIAAGMVVNTAAAGFTLTAAQMNSVWEMSGAGDVLIPADQCNSPGKWLTVISTAAHQNAIDFVDGDDDFYLSDGSEVDGADNELLLGGAAGNLVTLLCTSTANKWRVVGEIGTCTSQADD